MSREEYKQLEKLIGKLTIELGHNRFCIINDFFQEMCYMSVYDHKGTMIKSTTSYSIEDAVLKLNTQS